MSSGADSGAKDETLPDGAALRRIDTHQDDRANLGEVFRQEWSPGLHPLQWAVISSRANVLRGVHVHPRHDDYLVVLRGRAAIEGVDLAPCGITRSLETDGRSFLSRRQ